MHPNEQHIRELIMRWAHAVHAGDLDTVLANHAPDIVMFDVPPPHNGIRGIGAYEQTWPPFFTWQAQGAVFDIVELDVTAGDDVAFAFALLRCGSEQDLAAHPEARLRLTLGLRKEGDRWIVTHEHHSFADTSDAATEEPDSGATIRAIHDNWFQATQAKDLAALMSNIADDIVSYEHDAPLQYVGRNSVREVCKAGLDSAAGGVQWDVPELQVLIRDDIAVAWGLNRMLATDESGATVESWSRGTRLFQRLGRNWQMIHQHVSYPYDPESGLAATSLRPSTNDA